MPTDPAGAQLAWQGGAATDEGDSNKLSQFIAHVPETDNSILDFTNDDIWSIAEQIVIWA